MHLLTALPPSDRADHWHRYVKYLHERNGAPDFTRQRFVERERYFNNIDAKPVRRSGPPVVDQVVFSRNQALSAPEPGLDDKTLWALCTANINRVEDWGVRYGIALKTKQGLYHETSDQDPYHLIDLEENYHTRMLRDALETLGLRMDDHPPRPRSQALVRAMVRMPRAVSNMMILAAEVGGVVGFQLLLVKARELFGDQPEPLARIESLFKEIIIDEIGHIRFLRSQLSSAQMMLTRLMLPMVTRSFLQDLPEVVALFGRDTYLRAIDDLLAHNEIAIDDGDAHPLDRFFHPIQQQHLSTSPA